MNQLPEKRESLLLITTSPLIWATHFLVCYVAAAVWCEKVGGSLEVIRIAIAVATGLALAGIAATGWVGYRRHSYGTANLPHDFDTSEDRHRFIGFATLLLSGLSAVATVFVALTALFIDRCI